MTLPLCTRCDAPAFTVGPQTIHGNGWIEAIPALACAVCGTLDLQGGGISPGQAAVAFNDLFAVTRPVATVAWCGRCHPLLGPLGVAAGMRRERGA